MRFSPSNFEHLARNDHVLGEPAVVLVVPPRSGSGTPPSSPLPHSWHSPHGTAAITWTRSPTFQSELGWRSQPTSTDRLRSRGRWCAAARQVLVTVVEDLDIGAARSSSCTRIFLVRRALWLGNVLESDVLGSVKRRAFIGRSFQWRSRVRRNRLLGTNGKPAKTIAFACPFLPGHDSCHYARFAVL